MPVEADDLDRLGVFRGQLPLFGRHEQRHQHHDAEAHVYAVEAGQRVERRAGRVVREAHALPEEARELVDLTTDEHATQHRRGEQPGPRGLVVAPGQRRQRQDHGERAHEEHERTHRGERDVEDVGRQNVAIAPRLVEQVRRDQRTEEQTLRRQEQPHRQLVVGDAGVRGVRIVIVVGIGGRRRGRHQPSPSGLSLAAALLSLASADSPSSSW